MIYSSLAFHYWQHIQQPRYSVCFTTENTEPVEILYGGYLSIIIVFYFFSVLSVNSVVKNKKSIYVKENRKESQPLHVDMDTAARVYLARLISESLNRIYTLVLCSIKMLQKWCGKF
jgi:hypothetical protein